jgi:surfactin synthase thioesterase subunit
LWGIRLRSWRLAIAPTVVLSLAVTVGAIPQFTSNKEAYYLLGSLAGGYAAYAIARRIRKEAMNKMEQ